VRLNRRLRSPLIAKSSFEDASLGIAQASFNRWVGRLASHRHSTRRAHLPSAAK
jgi:hypothetical protein